MWWHYLLVFVGSMAVDIAPVPLPPAFTVMMILQLAFELNVWIVIAVGVAGSIAGRTILCLYIPKVSGRLFKRAKNEDIQYLGRRLQEKGWKTHALIFVYSLMPLPTTPLFVAAGMAKLHPMNIIPAFFLGKLISDTAAILMGKEAVGGTEDLLAGIGSWKSIAGLFLGALLLFALLFSDWRTLLQRHRLRLRFDIWK
jgi:uncharacterized membrane protein YdjX (TVP38/TMEM64 family)